MVNINNLFQNALDHYKNGRSEVALDNLKNILTINQFHFDSLYLLGIIYVNKFEYKYALEFFTKAIEINQFYAPTYLNVGNILFELERIEESIKYYDAALHYNQNFFEAYTNKGIALLELNLLSEALLNFDKAIEINPLYADAYSNRGNVLQELNLFTESLASYDVAIKLNPNYAEAYSNRGVVLHELKRYYEAIKSYEIAISILPTYTKAYTNLGITLHELKNYDQAMICFKKSISFNPNYKEAYCSIGNLLLDLSLLKESIEQFNIAIKIDPNYADAYVNKGIALKDSQLIEESLECFNTAIKLDKNNAEAYWNKSLTLLLSGNFSEGFELYEWRFKVKSLSLEKRVFNNKPWNGKENINGKVILIYSEQGLGDSIHLSRYIKLLLKLGAKILFLVQPTLINLLETIDNIEVINEKSNKLPLFDFHCALMSLPYVFKTDINTIPTFSSYLKTLPEKNNKWLNILSNKFKHRIGLVWSGSITHKNDRNRSINLETLIKYLPTTNIEYISLQKEIRNSDIYALNKSNIKHYENDIIDFSDTASICDLVDMVITVDTSVGHLAGALGIKTLILLPFSPDWRWMLNRNDSPWYSSVTLIRQKKPNDWHSVLIELNSLINDNLI